MLRLASWRPQSTTVKGYVGTEAPAAMRFHLLQLRPPLPRYDLPCPAASELALLTKGKVRSTNMERPVPGYEADYHAGMVKLKEETAARITVL